MGTFSSTIQSLDAKTSSGYGLIRMFLGLALAIRGGLIMSNPEYIMNLGVDRELFVWVSFIGIAHLVGGILLMIGFWTRLGALIQIPIVFSAIFFVYDYSDIMMGGQSLELAVLVLVLLVIFLIYGPGKFSLRNKYSNNKLNF
jgi:uncharacterized membrane protein YphA (DoxX/SURF4 family)